MNYRHFSGNKGESKFIELTEEQKRAVETQANIDVEAHKLSRFYKPAMNEEGVEEQLFNMLCNEYASKPETELKRYVILDSKALYYYPLTENRHKYYMKLAEERAKKMDERIILEKQLSEFKNYSR